MRAVLCVAWLAVASVAGRADDATLNERLRDADPGNGESVFFPCRACHTVGQGEPHRIGPNLWNIVDREIASMDSYSYSAALSELPGKWSAGRLDAYIRSPAEFAPGTKMVFPGLEDPAHRADLLSWLVIRQENKGASSSEREYDDSSVPADPFGPDWPEGPGRDFTGNTCNTCHSLAIVKQQSLSRESWEEVIDWMTEEQGLEALSGPDRTVIVEYLSTHFNIR
ncbi:MAG: hypothetical protein OXG56_03505 [Gammaproteobacteria bacterium]|nr:hypothetical protein [Gammaproteobacteria bacterium]